MLDGSSPQAHSVHWEVSALQDSTRASGTRPDRRPLQVFITVDAEYWPQDPDFTVPLRRTDLKPVVELRRDFFGETPRGAFGVPYQLEGLDRHGLRGTFFVEALSASVAGAEPLEAMVSTVLAAGQDVQLHLHTEWLKVEPNDVLPGRRGGNIRDFTLAEQRTLLAVGRDNLLAAGVPEVVAYRAGNFGADTNTLRALASLNIRFDSSHNAAFPDRARHIEVPASLRQPTPIEGVWEVPVSCFEDRPGHLRPAQIIASSHGEMEHALSEAWRLGWSHFVIVTHSNELLNQRRDGPNPIVRRRFDRLCTFLGKNRSRFETATFGGLNGPEMTAGGAVEPIRSTVSRTAWRLGEQLVQRWIG